MTTKYVSADRFCPGQDPRGTSSTRTSTVLAAPLIVGARNVRQRPPAECELLVAGLRPAPPP